MGVRFDTEDKVTVKVPVAIVTMGPCGDRWGEHATYEGCSSLVLTPHEDNVGEVTICLYHPDPDVQLRRIYISCKIKRLMLALRMLDNLGE